MNSPAPTGRSSYEKVCQEVRFNGHHFSCSLCFALIRTLFGSAFDPVHAGIRRGRCHLQSGLFHGTRQGSGPSRASQSPGRNIKEHSKQMVSVFVSLVYIVQRGSGLSIL